jgi:hypothetical protein
MNPRWLLLMSRLARNPPSAARVKLMLGIILVLLIIYLIEHFFGWPDFLTVEPRGRRWRP